MSQTLNAKQRRYLRGLAHALHTTVTVGQSGATPAVVDEIGTALAHHELMKIKLPPIGRVERRQLLDSIATACSADIVQLIGRIGVLYRPADTPKILIPAE